MVDTQTDYADIEDIVSKENKKTELVAVKDWSKEQSFSDEKKQPKKIMVEV